MEPQNNKQLALQKAISSHEQAAAGLADLSAIVPDERYAILVSRIQQNLTELHAIASTSQPDERV